MASIFTKIVNNEIPSYKLLEDENYLAFLDIFPINPGHLLVIPKKEVDYIYDLDDDLLTGLHLFSKKLAQALQKATNCKRVGVIVAGYDVPHTHIHLIPTNDMSDFNFGKKYKASEDELKEMAEKISKHL